MLRKLRDSRIKAKGSQKKKEKKTPAAAAASSSVVSKVDITSLTTEQVLLLLLLQIRSPRFSEDKLLNCSQSRLKCPRRRRRSRNTLMHISAL